MARSRRVWLGTAGGVGLLALTAWLARAPARVWGGERADADAVAAVLAGARGADGLVCELAVRTLDDRFGWRGPGGGGGGWPPDGDPVRADQADRLMAGLADPSAVAPLRAALGDTDACVRQVAAPLLGQIRTPGAMRALVDALGEASPATRTAAAIGLGYTRDVAPAAALVTALGDTAAGVRAAAAWALGRRGDRVALAPLTRLLRHDPDAVVRRMAAWALGRLDD
jgi:HEAT repeat protein